jgi:hypothetical protein
MAVSKDVLHWSPQRTANTGDARKSGRHRLSPLWKTEVLKMATGRIDRGGTDPCRK